MNQLINQQILSIYKLFLNKCRIILKVFKSYSQFILNSNQNVYKDLNCFKKYRGNQIEQTQKISMNSQQIDRQINKQRDRYTQNRSINSSNIINISVFSSHRNKSCLKQSKRLYNSKINQNSKIQRIIENI
ncbi:hypothetical protein ABPG74_006633 [Tetrahymena malaccensis]